MKLKHCFAIRTCRTARVLCLLSTAFLLAAAPVLRADSPSELLEKGIYSEETKGDLDAALLLYQQIVTESKAGQALAAQAQYRLGVCLYKKRHFEDATAAFEKVVKDYPDQKELVTLANQYLVGTMVLLPAPWTDGEEMRFDVKLGTGLRLGVMTCTAKAGELDGRKIWRVGSRMGAGVESFSRVEVEADTFKPIHSVWKHALIGEADAVYSPGHAEIRFKGKSDVKKVDLQPGIYDNEEYMQIVRRLPLAVGFKNNLNVMTSLGGGGIVPVKLEVTGEEKVTVAAGTYDCFKCQLNIGQTFWYATNATRYLVKFEAGGAVVELASVKQVQPGPVSYRDPLGFSVTAPADWLIDRSEPDDKGKVNISFLDPNAETTSVLLVGGLDKLTDAQQKSPRAWAESELVDGAKYLKDLKVREGTWKDRTLGGKPAVSVIVDFTEGKEKKAAYAVFAFDGTQAVEFRMVTGVADLDAFRPRLDSIIDSYQSK